MDYPEQKKETINGIPSQYFCHIQDVYHIGTVYPAHYHSYIEILFGLEGTFDVYLNGRNHSFKEGDLVLINSKEVHQINSTVQEQGKYLVLRFEPDIIYNSMSQSIYELKYVLPFMLDNTNREKVIKGDIINNSFVPDLLQEILKEFEMREYGYELAIKNHIGRIYLWILRYWYQSGIELKMNSMTDEELIKRLQPAFDFVLTNYEQDIKAFDMAKLCNMSYSYFSRKFNCVMKMNFSEYLNYIRIMEAEKLLVTTDLNITEVAVRVGFSTTSYFIKLFKSYKKVSPKKFKKDFYYGKED